VQAGRGDGELWTGLDGGTAGGERDKEKVLTGTHRPAGASRSNRSSSGSGGGGTEPRTRRPQPMDESGAAAVVQRRDKRERERAEGRQEGRPVGGWLRS
jgi:hypothetical protein